MARFLVALLVFIWSVRMVHGQASLPAGKDETDCPTLDLCDRGPGTAVVLQNQAVTNPHAIRYQQLPTQWAEGLPLGNGEIGVMCWSDGKRLRFTIDSASAWDLRHRQSTHTFQLGEICQG